MKKRTALLALLMLLVLTGCGAPSADSAAEMGSQETLGAALEEEPRPLTQMEVLNAYDRAVTAYSWFDLTPLPCGPEQEIVDGGIYRKVDYPGIEDMADLRTYLRVVFSQDLTDRLLERGDHPVYRDVNGELYAFDGAGRDRDSGKGTVEVEVEQEDERTYSVEVSVELLDSTRTAVIGVETYSFPYEFVEGSWVFTDFQMVY